MIPVEDPGFGGWLERRLRGGEGGRIRLLGGRRFCLFVSKINIQKEWAIASCGGSPRMRRGEETGRKEEKGGDIPKPYDAPPSLGRPSTIQVWMRECTTPRTSCQYAVSGEKWVGSPVCRSMVHCPSARKLTRVSEIPEFLIFGD